MQSKNNKTPLRPHLKGNTIGLDVEADGLNPYVGARIFCWAYITDKGEYGFMTKSKESLAWIANLFSDPEKHIVFHNAKWDLKMFGFEGININKAKAHFHCTLILSKLFNENGNHDLRGLAIRYLRRDVADKDRVEEWVRKNRARFQKRFNRPPNFSDAPVKLIRERNLWDAETTLYLFTLLYPKVKENCLSLYNTEMRLTKVCIDMENTGVQVDITRARELRKEALKDLSKIQKDLNDLVLPITITKKKKDKEIELEVTEVFNPRSPTEMPVAFTKLGIPLRYRTKPKKKSKTGQRTGGGNWSFDEYAMIRYVSTPLAAIIRDSGEEGWGGTKFYNAIYKAIKKHNLHRRELLPPLVLKFRELSKMVSTYYNHIIEDALDVFVTPTGREIGTLHCLFNQSEALTGRFSSSSINLQNMPRVLGPRECFIPRKGKINLHVDYEQVEMKLFVHFAEDMKMAKAIQEDIHLAVACNIYKMTKDQITKERRKRAKGINFGIIYGAGAPTIAETLTRKGLATSNLEAAHLVANYHKAYPSVRRITAKFKSQLVFEGYVANPFGRRYHVPMKYAYKVLNYMCQGTSADIMKAAMVETWEWLQGQEKFRAKLIMTIHDELVLEVSKNEVKSIMPIIKKFMEDLESFLVPITVSMEANKRRWSQKEKV